MTNNKTFVLARNYKTSAIEIIRIDDISTTQLMTKYDTLLWLSVEELQGLQRQILLQLQIERDNIDGN